MIQQNVIDRRLLAAMLAVTIGLFANGELAAQEAPLPQVAAYRVQLDGIDPFLCVKVKDVGVDIEKAPNRKPLPFRARIRDIELTKRFTKHRELHMWMHQAKNGQAEVKDGSIHFLDAAGKVVLQLNFVGAWLKSWSLKVPDINKGGFIKEKITLEIRDFELSYD